MLTTAKPTELRAWAEMKMRIDVLPLVLWADTASVESLISFGGIEKTSKEGPEGK